MKIQFVYSVIILLFINACARVGHPTGGDRDVTPPVVIKAIPPMETLNFKGNKIRIYFDEYIKFKNLNKQLIVSPPLNFPLEITPLGSASKYINITIKDTLKPNTTYTINFGNSIVDNSESNVLKQFKYLFSTGDFIDSLQINGVVKNALIKKSPENIAVLLYEMDSVFNDSVIFKNKPDYITNTLDTTFFSLTNLKEGKYLMIALKDASNNMIFNPKEDKIAFLDQPIVLPPDSINYNLVLFKEQPVFTIKKVFESSENHVMVAYEGLLKNNKVLNVVDNNKQPIPFYSYKDRKTDSLHIWFKDVKTDSIRISVSVQDSVRNFVLKRRTKEVDSLLLNKSIQQVLPLRDSLFITSNIPLEKIDSDFIHLIDKDSVKIPFTILKDQLRDKFQIAFDKKYNTRYSLSLFPNAVRTFLGQVNDTITIPFTTKEPKDYGEIDLKVMTKLKTSLIVELLTDKGVFITRNFVKNTTTIKYELLQPRKYRIRIIVDSNHNNRWDSGNFLERKQPERVLYYTKDIEVRANWVISEEFIVK